MQEILPQACFPGQPGPELETRSLPYPSKMTVEFVENGSDTALRSSDPEGVEKGYCKLQVAGFLSRQARSQTGLANWPECFMTYLLLLFLFGIVISLGPLSATPPTLLLAHTRSLRKLSSDGSVLQ